MANRYKVKVNNCPCWEITFENNPEKDLQKEAKSQETIIRRIWKEAGEKIKQEALGKYRFDRLKSDMDITCDCGKSVPLQYFGSTAENREQFEKDIFAVCSEFFRTVYEEIGRKLEGMPDEGALEEEASMQGIHDFGIILPDEGASEEEASTQSIHDFEITLLEECSSLTPINFGRGPRKVTIIVSGVPNSNTYIAKTYPQGSSLYFVVPVYNLTVSGTNKEGKEVSQTWQVLRFMPFLNENPQTTGYKTKTGETPIMAGLADKREQPIQSYLPNYEIHNTHSEENGGFVITGSFMIHDGPDNLQTEARMWGAAGCMEVVGENGFSTMKEFIFSISGSENTDMEKGLQELVNSKNLWLKLEGTQRPAVIEYKE